MGVPGILRHLTCSLAWPQPTRGLSSQGWVEGYGGPGLVELEGWEGQRAVDVG